MKRLIVLALVISALSSAAYAAGTLSGYVRDENGIAIAGARVWNFRETGAGTSVYTDANGYYSVNYMGTSPGIHVQKDGYTMPVRLQPDGWSGDKTHDWKLISQAGKFAPVYDTFSRANSSELGTTEDSGQFFWDQKGSGASIEGSDLVVNAGNIAQITTNTTSSFTPGNFDMTYKFKADAGFSWHAITYRSDATQGAVQDYNKAEVIFFNPDGRIFANGMNYDGGWGQPESTYRAATSIDWSVYHTVRLQVAGYNVRLYWDGVLVGDKYHNGQTVDANGDNKGGYEVRYDGFPYSSGPDYLNAQVGTGWIGFAAFGASTRIEEVFVTTTAVPEPGSIAALLAGMTGLVGFARRRRA